MNYASMIGVADETETARANSVIRVSRPIPKCHPDRPFAGWGLCPECAAASHAQEEPLATTPEAPITSDLRALPDRVERRPKSRDGRWLSPVEERVVEGLLQGLSNKEIGHLIGTTSQTVKNHMTLIFRKTGARSRSEVVVLWHRRQAGIDVDGALAYLGQVQRAIASVQGDVDRLLRSVRDAQMLLTVKPLASEDDDE